MTHDEMMLGVFPYVAITLAVLVTVWRYATNQFSFSSMSSQFLENKQLFFGSVPFHYGILAVLGGHLIGLLMPSGILLWNGSPMRLYILEISGLAFGFLALWGIFILIFRRTGNARIWMVTSTMDIVLLVVLLAQIVAGLWIAVFYQWGSSWYAGFAVPYLWSVFALNPDISLVSNMPLSIKLHIFGGFLLVALIPFTRLVHFLSFPFDYLWRPHQVVIWNRKPGS
jgi:nitrate reductase gamma subunit